MVSAGVGGEIVIEVERADGAPVAQAVRRVRVSRMENWANMMRDCQESARL